MLDLIDYKRYNNCQELARNKLNNLRGIKCKANVLIQNYLLHTPGCIAIDSILEVYFLILAEGYM